MLKSHLSNWMLGVQTIFAAALLFIPVGVFFAGLGLMTLHAFGLVAKPY